MSRGASFFERPLDRILEAFRECYLDAYRSHAGRVGVWSAYCPACSSFAFDRRRLAVREPYPGAPVTLWCSNGCREDAILEALYPEPAPPPLADPVVVGRLALEALRARRELSEARRR